MRPLSSIIRSIAQRFSPAWASSAAAGNSDDHEGGAQPRLCGRGITANALRSLAGREHQRRGGREQRTLPQCESGVPRHAAAFSRSRSPRKPGDPPLPSVASRHGHVLLWTFRNSRSARSLQLRQPSPSPGSGEGTLSWPHDCTTFARRGFPTNGSGRALRPPMGSPPPSRTSSRARVRNEPPLALPG